MLTYLHISLAVTAERKRENDVTTDPCSPLKNRLKSMAAVKYEFPIGALKAFYSIFCPDILLVYISRNAVSENKKIGPNPNPKVSSKCPFKFYVPFLNDPSGLPLTKVDQVCISEMQINFKQTHNFILFKEILATFHCFVTLCVQHQLMRS